MPLLISCSGWVYYTEDLEHCGPRGDVTDVNTDSDSELRDDITSSAVMSHDHIMSCGHFV